MSQLAVAMPHIIYNKSHLTCFICHIIGSISHVLLLQVCHCPARIPHWSYNMPLVSYLTSQCACIIYHSSFVISQLSFHLPRITCHTVICHICHCTCNVQHVTLVVSHFSFRSSYVSCLISMIHLSFINSHVEFHICHFPFHVSCIISQLYTCLLHCNIAWRLSAYFLYSCRTPV